MLLKSRLQSPDLISHTSYSLIMKLSVSADQIKRYSKWIWKTISLRIKARMLWVGAQFERHRTPNVSRYGENKVSVF